MADKENIEMIREVAVKERMRLKDDPNIIDVSYGIKRSKGKVVKGLSILYYVRTKLPDEESIIKMGSAVIPKDAEGFPTDVVVAPIIVPNGSPTGDRGSQKENPLVGGTSTAVLSDWHSFPTGYGTLGGICFDKATEAKKTMAISNAHVWGMDAGKSVIQPWMPTGEYLKAAVKMLTCGPVVSMYLGATLPSPLTAGLASGAAAAFTAAIMSDFEDPSRWGQRVSQVPPATARTIDEKVHLEAEVPENPFSGVLYSTKTSWEYTRDTDQGSYNEKIVIERKNEHVISDKRVWTEKDTYRGGDRVKLCAEIAVADPNAIADDYFVVAHCFPKSDPERLVQRLLIPGECEFSPPENKNCFQGFPLPAKPGQQVNFPLSIGVFQFTCKTAGKFSDAWPPDVPDPKTTLVLPLDIVNVNFPPCSRVTIDLFHTFLPVTALARDAAGNVVDSATMTNEPNKLQTLELKGANIQSVVLRGGGDHCYLIGMCIFFGEDSNSRCPRPHYTGYIDLNIREPPDRWGVALFVQTANNQPRGLDPISAAKYISGIVISANVGCLTGCNKVVLLDYIFNVV